MPKDFDDLAAKTHDLTGQQRSMRGRDKLNDIRDDERRSTSKYGNKNEGTRIIAGETIFKKKKPGQQHSPKPVDAISGSRQSGPVRAQGKQKQGAGQETYKGLDLESQNTPDFERPERPSKRRRRNPQETATNLSDDEVMAQSAPGSETPTSGKPKRRPGTNRHSNKMADQQKNRQHNMSSDDERFTENAAKERRDMSSDSEDLSQTPKPAVLQSVQVPKLHPKNPATSRSLQSQIMITDSNFDPHAESPDELQGEATTQPIPAVLPVGCKKNASNGSSLGTERAAGQRSSPTDIKSTEFSPSTPQGNRVRKKARKKAQNRWSFEALLVQDGNIQLRHPDDESTSVHFDKSKGVLEFAADTTDSPHQFSFPLKRVVQIIQGNDPSCKLRFNLSKMESPVGPVGPIDIELSSTEEKNNLRGLFRDVSIQYKDSKFMDGAFKKAARDMSLHANKSKRLSSEGVPEPTSEPKIEVVVKRQKISDSLEAGDESTKPSIDTNKDHPKTPVPAKDPNEDADHDVHGHPARESVSNTVETPVKETTPEVPSHGRETRSSRRSLPATHDLCDDDDDDQDPNPQPAHGGECKRWEKPLVYPRFGKKKAEVDAQDLERLRDNEFLNDNLIGFYIRFLEDHLDRTNKEAAKKVYFFNSYFYATLTNKRPINYESVQKWTRTVDIFSHDYVVIPINEAAHWYVAIICNLPNLKSDSEEPGPDKALPEAEQKEPPPQAEAEIQAIPGTPEPSQEVVQGPEEGEGDQKPDAGPVKEEITRQSMAAMTLGDKEVPASANEEWPEKEENPPASPARFSSPPKTRVAQQKGQKNTPKTSPRKPKKQKKKPRDHLDPRDPREPVIITFDSLDFPRALTTRNLRQYLAAEAKSKKGTDINTSRMAGIRARNIPFQNNSSDCGLYMLAYLEKFVQDPDTFVSRLLQGQMSVGADWPPLSSGPLRLRLRQFLDDLYDEQGQLGSERAIEKPPMADKKPISFLLPEQEPDPQQNTNTNPEAAASQAKPPSPQPTTEPSEPSAAPPPPSEAPKSPEVEAQLSTAGPLKTPDSPARNLRHRRSNNNPGPPKAVRSAAALFGRFNQRTESGADRDIVEVPDSQEHVPHAHPMITDLSSPTKLKNPDETDVRAPVSASKLDKQKKGDVVTVDDGDGSVPAPAPASASDSDPAVVEVQIKETPPPELNSAKEKH